MRGSAPAGSQASSAPTGPETVALAARHPCGKLSLGGQADPHEKYFSYYPARIRQSAKPQTTEAAPAAA